MRGEKELVCSQNIFLFLFFFNFYSFKQLIDLLCMFFTFHRNQKFQKGRADRIKSWIAARHAQAQHLRAQHAQNVIDINNTPLVKLFVEKRVRQSGVLVDLALADADADADANKNKQEDETSFDEEQNENAKNLVEEKNDTDVDIDDLERVDEAIGIGREEENDDVPSPFSTSDDINFDDGGEDIKSYLLSDELRLRSQRHSGGPVDAVDRVLRNVVIAFAVISLACVPMIVKLIQIDNKNSVIYSLYCLLFHYFSLLS